MQLTRLLIVAHCVACAPEPEPAPTQTSGAEEEVSTVETVESETASTELEPDEEAWPPGPLVLWPTMQIEDDDLTETRVLGLRHDGERWLADFAHRSRSASTAWHVVVTSRSLDSRLAEVGRGTAPIRMVEVLGVMSSDDGLRLAFRAQSERGGSDTAVRLHSMGDTEPETLVRPLGELERASEWKSFAAASIDPPRAIAALVGSTRRRRPAAQLAPARRAYERASEAGEILEPPSETQHVRSWLKLVVSTERDTRAHEVWRAPAQNRGAANDVRVAAVVAGAERHAAVFLRREDGGHARMHVWLLDASDGARVATFEETQDDLHSFAFRDGVIDAEGRLWLVGQTTRGSSPNHPILYVFARSGELISRRMLDEQRRLDGAGLVECHGAMWLIESGEARGETSAHLWRLPAERDLLDPTELEGDPVMRTIQTSCHDNQAAALFERTDGYGFVTWN